MTKKELLNRIEELEETMGMQLDAINHTYNNLKSQQGQVPNWITQAVKPLKDNLAFNAKLMNLLMEHFKIGFYEIPAQESKIEIRKKSNKKK